VDRGRCQRQTTVHRRIQGYKRRGKGNLSFLLPTRSTEGEHGTRNNKNELRRKITRKRGVRGKPGTDFRSLERRY